MKRFFLLGLLFATPALGDDADRLCAGNPAYSPDVMLKIVQAQLQGDHDPSLDADTPENIAKQAVAQGIAECATALRKDPSIAPALRSLTGADLQVGWDAYNTACADHSASRGACITAEVQSDKALKRMAATDEPSGARAIVQTCELVMQTDPPLAEWRQCVDQGLAVHASGSVAAKCKLSATWHVAKTGAEAARIVAACLRGGS